MKVCPTCQRVFDDDTLRFCLMDGAPLADGHSEPTVVVTGPQTAAETVVMTGVQQGRPTEVFARPKSKVPWIIGGVLGMIVLVTISALLLSLMVRRGEQVRADQNAAKNASRSGNSRPVNRPGHAATPVSTPSVEPSQTDQAVPDEASEEFTPITWTTIAVTFNSTPGRTFSFECPPDGVPAGVWGSDIYTGDSSICAAALHAGVITLEEGGKVTIEYRPGRTVYGSTTRNGITSNPFGQYHVSFMIRKPGEPTGDQPANEP